MNNLLIGAWQLLGFPQWSHIKIKLKRADVWCHSRVIYLQNFQFFLINWLVWAIKKNIKSTQTNVKWLIKSQRIVCIWYFKISDKYFWYSSFTSVFYPTLVRRLVPSVLLISFISFPRKQIADRLWNLFLGRPTFSFSYCIQM